MINFFRKTRKQLADDNKPLKYLRYAIGEIVLVVIGILIALSINNWNEERKLRIEEIGLLHSLKNELENNLDIMKPKLDFNNEVLTAMNVYLENADIPILDYEKNKIDNLIGYTPAIINSPVLDNILESNSRSIISDNELIEKFRKLKTGYISVEKDEFFLDEFWNSKVTNFLIEYGLGIEQLEPRTHTKYVEQQVKKLSRDKQFIALISIKRTLQRDWYTEQQRAYKSSEQVLDNLKLKLVEYD